MVKNLSANAGDIKDTGSIPGSGRSLTGGHGNSLRYSCLENPPERGAWKAWRATVYRIKRVGHDQSDLAHTRILKALSTYVAIFQTDGKTTTLHIRMRLTYTHTTLCKRCKQQKPTIKHRELYSILCNNPQWKRIWKSMCVWCVCVYIYTHTQSCVYIYIHTHNHFAVYLKLTTL